jgi:hypothetical protein
MYRDQYLYIISGCDKSSYKIGTHTGNSQRLLSRYKTSLINPVIHFMYPTTQSYNIEKMCQIYMKDICMIDDNGRKTEWYSGQLDMIIKRVMDIIDLVLNSDQDDDDDERIQINIYPDDTFMNVNLSEGGYGDGAYLCQRLSS